MRTDDQIGQVNRALKQFAVEVTDDPLARNRADVSVIAFQEPGLRIETPFTLARDFRPPTLGADGRTPMGGAIRLGLETIRTRRAEYRSRGAKSLAAMMFLITDGEPTDEVEGAAREAHEFEREGKLNFFCVGTRTANFQKLAAISPPDRAPAELEVGKFRELFRWISDAVTAAANSSPGQKLPLPPAQGWASAQA